MNPIITTTAASATGTTVTATVYIVHAVHSLLQLPQGLTAQYFDALLRLGWSVVNAEHRDR